MELCSKCHKRMAVIYMSRLENGKTVNEGLCLKCAKELGIKPINDMISQMGLSDEELEQMDSEVEGLIESLSDEEDGDNISDDETKAGRAPAFDIRKLFGAFQANQPSSPTDESNNKGETPKKDNTQEKKKDGKFISQFCINLTLKAFEGKIDRVIGRENELARVIQILCRRQKNNPCLIGEPGVGKTAIAESLAIRINEGNVPFKLRNKQVYLLDLTSLVAGTQFRGQFEQRMKGLINEVKDRGNIILVIDEVHSLVGAGDAEGSMNAANILKPALSRGEIQVIGSTTLKEYRKYIEKDSALERRFQPVVVEESNIEDTIEILKGIKGYYESFHWISIPDDTIRKIVTLSERYITDRFLPDKAIDLLDESSAYSALHSAVIDRYSEVKQRISELQKEKETTEQIPDSENSEENQAKYEKLADIKIKEIKYSDELKELELKKKNIKLKVSDIAQVIEKWTGVPASNITEAEYERLIGLENRLKSRVIGQDKAVSSICRAIKRNRAGVSYKRKPVSFIFAGPTGVGKTELVKTLASDLFDSPDSLIRLDMSEFMEKHSVSRIMGAPPGYVGYDEAGQLTEKIRRKPYSVVLFDEIEKAHPDVLNILLQILDDGVITDAQGRKVNFENTVIVMTTNAGSDVKGNAAGFSKTYDTVVEDRTVKALESFLRPEFINRIDDIIVFRSLDENDFVKIVDIMLGDLRKTLEDKKISLIYTDKAKEFIAKKSFNLKFGARNIRRYIQNNIEDIIADKLIAGYSEDINKVSVDV